MAPHLRIIAGPSCSGKTALARRITEEQPDKYEIISVDAFQVYRGFDRGTAKPDAAFRDAVPHHLIDVCDPVEAFDVGQFVQYAHQALAEIQARGKVPLLVGGTIFYLKHLVFGLPEAPPASADVRQHIAARREAEGINALRDELLRVDPISGARIHANDEYRILRALEVYHTAGVALSSFRRESAARFTYTCVWLDPPKEKLAKRIEERTKAMFADGLRLEWLRHCDSGLSRNTPAMKAIGYQEFFEFTDDESVAESICIHTRQYAKRQRVFLRAFPDVHRVENFGDEVNLANLLP